MRATGNMFGQIPALRALGIIAARTGESGWHAHFEAALQLSQERGCRVELSVCRLRYAEALAQAGQTRQALEQLDLADALMRELDMRWWPDRGAEVRARLASYR